MMQHPVFFEPVRQRASARWDQLEGDPELAGPWHRVFKQVQSPRHVVSELLQNADDAGASEAFAYIADDVFVFEHNGEDFTEEHFASLCRFGYLPVNRCLELEPLELDAEVWALLDRRPSLYAFILPRPDGAPVEVAGTLLRSMRENGDLTLYPARYRIVRQSREERREA